jgi:multidrug efflux system outer membrane protein
MRFNRLLVAGSLTLLIGACRTVGPNYARPTVEAPSTYRGADDTAPVPASFADQHWDAVFTDDVLRQLIRTALERNYDVRIAAVRILEAQAQFGITRADRFPTFQAQAIGQGQDGTVVNGNRLPAVGSVQIGGSFIWDLDFWGKYRRASEAARAEILASEWGRRAVISSLVSGVATSYYDLRALDSELDISQRTLASREESLRLTEVREQGGATSLVDVRQAEQLVITARGQIVDLQRRIEASENALQLLLGANPGPIDRGKALVDQPHPPDVPAGLTSALLDRRPDIREVEQQLVAANAQIGVARAAYFPDISLTGSGGLASTSLLNLFTAGAWSAAATAVQPVFNAGRNRSRVELAEARRQEAELEYRRTVQQAFREVSDALSGYRRFRELRETQEALVVAAQDARRLADLRYQGGATSYLEVLDSETRLFGAQLALVQAQLDEQSAFVEIYRALGGGWEG